ncbi:SIR2 family protein [Bradyrhizobium sp. RP6]|uniref:SIR2 family protein n=1 Tax=Bradyrhizobium sp. RP6 TaxID=2489596 RepID=UPI000F544F4C|nr:SIR2 family protein [Bradyrhizobium sp. RP6]RQH12463.1 SIR2 family protein [Bradyrhizobium sp. RP6]
MNYWDDRPASVSNVRFYKREDGWRAHDDAKNGEGQVTERGSARLIEESLTASLNASNLILLTGAGSSFCAKNNAQNGITAPGMKDLWDAVLAEASQDSVDAIARRMPLSNQAIAEKNIEKLLTQCKIYLELFGREEARDVAAFIASAEQSIAARVDFVSEQTDLSAHQAILRKIARRGARKPRARLFTTNYDLSFEYAARALRFTVVDGFTHTMPQVYDAGNFAYDIVRRDSVSEGPEYIESVFHLYKLHGSIDWRRKEAELIRSRSEVDGPAVLIYPRDSKYQEAFETPFLDMMSALQTALRQPDTALIVSGFGFNDDHISKPIMAALEANMTLRLVVCDIAFLTDEELEKNEHLLPTTAEARPKASPCFSRLKRLADIGDQRVTLLNARFDDLAQAIPDLVAQTERERHAERIKILNEPSAV